MDTTKLECVIQDAISEAAEEEEQAVVLGDSCSAYANLVTILDYARERVAGLLKSAHKKEYGDL